MLVNYLGKFVKIPYLTQFLLLLLLLQLLLLVPHTHFSHLLLLAMDLLLLLLLVGVLLLLLLEVLLVGLGLLLKNWWRIELGWLLPIPFDMERQSPVHIGNTLQMLIFPVGEGLIASDAEGAAASFL